MSSLITYRNTLGTESFFPSYATNNFVMCYYTFHSNDLLVINIKVISLTVLLEMRKGLNYGRVNIFGGTYRHRSTYGTKKMANG